MKTFVILATLLYIAAVAAQPAWLPGRRTQGRATKPKTDVCLGVTTSKKICNGDADAICDATGYVQCSKYGRPADVPCGGNTPHCGLDDNGQAKCFATRSETCGEPVSENDCLSAGVFPDLTNCKKFYVCESDGEGGFYGAEDFTCDKYYVFDPNGYQNDYCRFTRDRYCIQIDCKGQTKNVVVNYPGFPTSRGQIVAQCNANRKPVAARCEAGFLADLNSSPVECKLNCRGAGKFPYEEDSSKYLECVWTGRNWEPKVKSCFRNYIFNKEKKQCVVDTSPKTTTVASTTTTAAGATTTAAGATTTAAGATTTAADATTTAAGATTTAAGATTTAADATTTAAGVTTTAADATTTAADATTTAAGATTTAADATTTAAGATTTAADATTTAAGETTTVNQSG